MRTKRMFRATQNGKGIQVCYLFINSQGLMTGQASTPHEQEWLWSPHLPLGTRTWLTANLYPTKREAEAAYRHEYQRRITEAQKGLETAFAKL